MYNIGKICCSKESKTSATRLAELAKARKSLPLTERDLADLERLRGQTPERDALAELSGVAVESVTEAALLHMIFAAGLRAIRGPRSTPTPVPPPTGWPAERQTRSAASRNAGGPCGPTRTDTLLP